MMAFEEELNNRIESLEEQKREMEAKFIQANMERNAEIERKRVLEEAKRELESKFLQIVMEKNAEIEEILKEKIAAEAEKSAFEEESKRKVVVLTKRIEALKEQKGEMEADVSRANKRILNEKIAAYACKMAVEEELNNRIESLEEEKREMEAKFIQANMGKNAEIERKSVLEEDIKKMVVVLTKRNEALEEEKMEFESKVLQTITEKNAEIEGILKEKIAAEVEISAFEEESKKVVVLTKRIEALEEQKGEMEADVSRANKRILNEKIAAYACKMAVEEELNNRIESLEEEKREMEAKLFKQTWRRMQRLKGRVS